MKIRCVWEHNGNDSILYADNFIGVFKEEWSLRKVLRRFIWHDGIHAKAIYEWQ